MKLIEMHQMPSGNVRLVFLGNAPEDATDEVLDKLPRVELSLATSMNDWKIGGEYDVSCSATPAT